jgi:hypothetical protein
MWCHQLCQPRKKETTNTENHFSPYQRGAAFTRDSPDLPDFSIKTHIFGPRGLCRLLFSIPKYFTNIPQNYYIDFRKISRLIGDRVIAFFSSGKYP